jgi:hypothetical protein
MSRNIILFSPLQELWNGDTAGKLSYFPGNPYGLVRLPVMLQIAGVHDAVEF